MASCADETGTARAKAAEDPEAAVAGAEERAEIRRTPCGDGHLVWRLWGVGAPLVLLHGGSGSWTHWLRNIDELSRHYRLLVPDLPGLGESAEPPHPFDDDDPAGSLAMLAGILRTGLDEILGAETPYRLAGFSFGSILGGYLAAAEGARVACFVLVGSAALGPPRKGLRARLQRVPREASEAEAIEIQRRNLGIHMLSGPERVDELAARLQWRNVAATRLKSRGVARSDALRRALPHIRAPLNGIWGRLDAYAPPRLDDIAEVLHAHDAQARFEVIEDAGHWVMYERPGVFNERLLDILAARAA